MKIDFEFSTAHGLFRDALHLPDGHTSTDEDIQSMKNMRVSAWVTLLENPPTEGAIPEYIEIDGVQYVKVG